MAKKRKAVSKNLKNKFVVQLVLKFGCEVSKKEVKEVVLRCMEPIRAISRVRSVDFD